MEYDTATDHGNNCAGLVAAVQGNMFCSSGVAPDAKLAALKFIKLNDPVTSTDITKVLTYIPSDLMEALTYKMDQIHIYSNSFGPGENFSRSAAVVNEAFRKGITEGRNGKGSIYVIAAGNNGHFVDVNLDGFVNSIYTIAISSVGEKWDYSRFRTARRLHSCFHVWGRLNKRRRQNRNRFSWRFMYWRIQKDICICRDSFWYCCAYLANQLWIDMARCSTHYR